MNTIKHENKATARRSAIFLIVGGGVIALLGWLGSNQASMFFGVCFSLLSLACLGLIVKERSDWARLIWGLGTPVFLWISPALFPSNQSLALVTFGYMYIAGMLYCAYSFDYEKERTRMWLSISLFLVGMLTYDRVLQYNGEATDSLGLLIEQHYFYFKSVQALHFVSLVALILIVKNNKARIERKLSLQIAKMSGMTSGLVDISQSHLVHSGNLIEALKEVISFVCRSLDISRISLWEFDEQKNAIRLLIGYDGLQKSYFDSAVLNKADYPQYFAHLLEEKLVNAFDAQADNRTKEFATSYLIPNNILSMMDSPFFIDGQFKGVLCYEEQRYRKRWDEVDQLFSMAVSKLISVAYYCHFRKEQYRLLKEANEELERKNVALEAINLRVMEMNDEMANNVLSQDQGIQELKRFIDDISFRNSHHLRAPLSRILGIIKLYRYETNPEGRALYMDLIEKSAEELDHIVRDIARTLSETRGDALL